MIATEARRAVVHRFQQRIRDVTSNHHLSFAETRKECSVSPECSLWKTKNVTSGPEGGIPVSLV
jgi:hypothetical protein